MWGKQVISMLNDELIIRWIVLNWKIINNSAVRCLIMHSKWNVHLVCGTACGSKSIFQPSNLNLTHQTHSLWNVYIRIYHLNFHSTSRINRKYKSLYVRPYQGRIKIQCCEIWELTDFDLQWWSVFFFFYLSECIHLLGSTKSVQVQCESHKFHAKNRKVINDLRQLHRKARPIKWKSVQFSL